MEEIDLKELFYYYFKKIPITLTITVLFIVIGTIYTFVGKTPMYSSDVTIVLVSGNNEEAETVIQTNISINEKLVSTYSEIVTSRKVLNQVIKELKLDYTYKELRNMITINGVSDTEIIKIEVKSENALEAQVIANKTAVVFERNVQDIYNLQNVAMLDEAILAEEAYNDNKIKDICISTIIGIIISSIIIFMMYYFDDSVQSAEVVEKRLGIPVIGQLPLNVDSNSNPSKKTKKRKGWLKWAN